MAFVTFSLCDIRFSFDVKNLFSLVNDLYHIFLKLRVYKTCIYYCYRGLVPLHNASSFGHLEVVNLLLEAGADSQAEDLWKFTPLHESASKGRLEVCLHTYIAWLTVKASRILLFKLYKCLRNFDFNRFKVVKLLVASGADPTRKIGSTKAPIEYITDEDDRKQVLYEYDGYKIYMAAQIGDILMVRKFLVMSKNAF